MTAALPVLPAWRLLVAVRARQWRHRAGEALREHKLRLGVAIAFAAGFWTALYALFHRAFDFIQDYAPVASGGAAVLPMLFHAFFFALTLMLTISNAILCYSSLYRSRETAFLLGQPIRPAAIFLLQFTNALFVSSWAFAFLGLPMLLAYAEVFKLGPAFVLAEFGVFLLFLTVPAGLGAWLAIAAANVFPRTGRGLALALTLAAVGLGTFFILKLAEWRHTEVVGTFIRTVEEIVQQEMGFTRNPLIPSYWVSMAVLEGAAGRAGRAAWFVAVIASNGLLLLLTLVGTSNALLLRGWTRAEPLRRRRLWRRGRLDGFWAGCLGFVSREVRWIVLKDAKSFLRDPVQFSQFLIFFGLLGIYFANLRTFGYEGRELFWRNLIAQLNLLATALTLATFASRFIYPQVSLEGRRFWILGMIPMPREKILLGKFTLCFVSSIAISEVLMAVSSLMLETPLVLWVLHAVALLGICLGISGLAVGLGTIYPNFREDNPSRIVSGFGGTVNLLVMLTFVGAVLVLELIPSMGYARQALLGFDFRRTAAVSVAAIGGLSLATAFVPMGIAMRRIRRIEV